MSSRSPYSGSRSTLAIAIDVGTTYSGASYTLLVPGEIPRIYDVTGFKGQENRESNTKVPSVLLYSNSGELVACGAETKKLGPKRGIRTEWLVVHKFNLSSTELFSRRRRFKLELRPPSLRIDTPKVDLPPDRTVVDVFGDFLKYMYDCVRDHIINTHVDGNQRWSSLHGKAHFVLRMREAAIGGGLIPDTPEGHERVEFVTEGEASFHWCIDQAIAGAALKEGTNIVVADLGGGTVDVSSFLVKATKPLRLQEQMAPECALAGSITVTDRFVKAISERLQGTPYDESDYIETLREEFDEEAKCLFREDGEPETYIRIGGRRDNFEGENGLCKIEFGLLEVQREDIMHAFEPSVDATAKAIQKHIAGRRDTHIFLVGGFAASPWMLSEIRRRLKAAGIKSEVKRADSNTAKAVAHGAVAFYLDRNVTERKMRYTYGVSLEPSYNPSDPEHKARRRTLYTDQISGMQYVKSGFFALVNKGQLVKVDNVYRKRFYSEPSRKPELTTWSQSIERYNGTRANVTFKDVDPSAFEPIGWFRCDIPASAMTQQTGPRGAFYEVEYDVVITLGTVEIKAHVEWEEGGVKKKTPANSIWEDYY
ncbi:glycoside hydrolase family 11 protein [Tulasnella calospora MUT 4182]|uniref:Glycoside hydrolase family 11 protein n=1 Tax=Tulasnella calospora MUT 4182 TaxID=1051891 RepID=A0A0C3M1A6_9AGAM|nr:glycoside hydrolase family 11 protein [Tulasnella calospora MUT 4182]